MTSLPSSVMSSSSTVSCIGTALSWVWHTRWPHTLSLLACISEPFSLPLFISPSSFCPSCDNFSSLMECSDSPSVSCIVGLFHSSEHAVWGGFCCMVPVCSGSVCWMWVGVAVSCCSSWWFPEASQWSISSINSASSTSMAWRRNSSNQFHPLFNLKVLLFSASQ